MNIYDFDDTIYKGDSSKDFFKYCLKRKKSIIFDIISICFMLGLYLIKVIEKEKFKSSFFRFLKRIDGEAYTKDFWQENEHKIKDFYKKKHKKSDIVISASPYFLLEPIAKIYGFKLIATNMDIKTGRIKGVNCYGKEKVKRLNAIGIKSCDNFYSDSLSDLPMFKIAKKGYIVKQETIIPYEEYHEKKSLLKEFLSRDFITFLFIGAINAFNGVWIAYVYSLFITNEIIAYILGFLTSLCIAYILNSVLNFKAKLSFNKFMKFALSNIPNFIIQVTSVVVLIRILEIPKLFSYMVSAIIAVPITFILVKFSVFEKDKKESSV